MNWLQISLKLLSITASAFFAIFALITKFKDDAGHITKAGTIAIYGVIGSCALSIVLYILDVRSAVRTAQRSKAEAEAAAQRVLTPLGPMRIRLMLRIPANQFDDYRKRLLTNSTWRQSYPMPVGGGDMPGNEPAETGARNFFSLIMLALSVDIESTPGAHASEFGKLLVFSLPSNRSHEPMLPNPKSAGQDGQGRVTIFFDRTRDSFLAQCETDYFDDFDSSRRLLSFQDFSGKWLRLAFNVRERIDYGIDFIEIQSRSGKRRLFIKQLTRIDKNRDTFNAPIVPDSFLD